MISVIIPTMWFSHRTVPMLEELCDNDHVSEILIVDNNKSIRPPLPESDKIRMFEQDQNIYCNPAWNLGVSNSRCPICILLNDDVTFDTKFLKNMSDGLKNYGVVGVHPESYGKLYGREMKKEDEGKLEHGGLPPSGWGCVLCFKTKDYVEIPEEFKVWVGDDWIVKTIGNTGSIKMNVQTEMSTTGSRPEMEEMKLKEIEVWRKGLESGLYRFNR